MENKITFKDLILEYLIEEIKKENNELQFIKRCVIIKMS